MSISCSRFSVPSSITGLEMGACTSSSGSTGTCCSSVADGCGCGADVGGTGEVVVGGVMTADVGGAEFVGGAWGMNDGSL